MQVRVKTSSLVTAFGTFHEGELMTVSTEEAAGFLAAGHVEALKEEPGTATVKNKNAERATRAGGRA